MLGVVFKLWNELNDKDGFSFENLLLWLEA